MGRVIVVASGKGGVGKTTIAANLAVALSLYKRDVAVLDADIVMANLEIILGLRSPPVALIDVLKGDVDIKKVIYRGPAGVKVVPAGITLDGFNEENMAFLRACIRDLSGELDILVVDAPAGRDAAMVMDKGQEVLIVTTPHVSSISDALKMKMLAESIGAKVVGTIVNMVTGKRREVSIVDIEKAIGASILSVIPKDEKVEEALSKEVPFVLKYPNSKASRAVMNLAAMLIGEEPIYRESFFEKILKIFKR